MDEGEAAIDNLEEDIDALEEGVVIALTVEEMEAKRKAMGDEFELVEVDDDGEDEDEEEADDSNTDDTSSDVDDGMDREDSRAAIDDEDEDEVVASHIAVDAHDTTTDADEAKAETSSSQAYSSHFDVAVDGGNAVYTAAVDTEKKSKKPNFVLLTDKSAFGSVFCSAPSLVVASSLDSGAALKLRKKIPAGLIRSRLLVSRKESAIGEKRQCADTAEAPDEVLDYSPLQTDFFQLLTSYRDVFIPLRTLDNGDELRQVWALHILNHVLSARARVLRHSSRLRSEREQQVAGGSRVEVEYRDQGFSRPRVLVLLPYRSSAAKLVHTLAALFLVGDQEKALKALKGYGRFKEEFVDVNDDEPEHPNADHRRVFDGNSDDCFKLGLQFSKTSFSLFADFYASDVIIASPLGLRMVVGADGEKERDFDFLSSIEVCIIDQADSIVMQNWEHVSHIFEHLSLLPSSPRQTDITRIRPWFLEGWAQYFRQTVLVSEFASADMNALFNRNCHNISGKIRVSAVTEGAIVNVIPKVPQKFHRFTCENLKQDSSTRFEYFMEKIMTSVSTPLHSHVLIFIPNYFDYVVLRNHFRREKMSFSQICEYTSKANVSRARSNFFHGYTKFLLYTQRHYYHHRLKIRGVKHVVFYAPPDYPQFYNEILDSIDMSDTESSSTVLYSRNDQPALERIAGTARTQQQMASDKAIFLFI